MSGKEPEVSAFNNPEKRRIKPNNDLNESLFYCPGPFVLNILKYIDNSDC